MKSLATSENFDVKVLTEIGSCLMTTITIAKPIEIVEMLLSHSTWAQAILEKVKEKD